MQIDTSDLYLHRNAVHTADLRLPNRTASIIADLFVRGYIPEEILWTAILMAIYKADTIQLTADTIRYDASYSK